MITVGDVYQALDAFAPFSTQEKWDNSGLLVGSAQMPAERIYVTLDLSAETIAAARAPCWRGPPRGAIRSCM